MYFLGIGGIGMSALARYFNAAGKKVSGYDKTPTKLTEELIAEGIQVHFDDDVKNISSEVIANKQESLIVLTPAIPADHKEWNFLKENNFTIQKRSQVLGTICAAHKTFAVAGTHGKTTTSSMLAHILKSAGAEPVAFLGGITQNYNTNLFLPEEFLESTPAVVEADEYDRSFLTLFPHTAIITSTDPDHLDIYGSHNYMLESYTLFASQVKAEGILILKKGLDISSRINRNYITYSLHDNSADFYALNKRIVNGYHVFDIKTPSGIIKDLKFGLPGSHNVENAVAASAAALLNGIREGEVRKALETFLGVKRRFDYQIRRSDLIFIDDYAHHPRELSACINSVKELYPGKKITGVFQPHLFTRTRDFAEGFAESLSLLDDLILLDIYPAREKPIPGITSGMLLEMATVKNKMLVAKNELVRLVKNKKPEILLTLGAGDIDMLVDPLREALE